MQDERKAEPLTEKALRAKAIQALARREHSRYELEKKLLPLAQSSEQLEQVLDQLAHENLLSDQRYAQSVSRVRGGRYGAARVALELRAKGVDDAVISAAAQALHETELTRAHAVWQKKFGVIPATLNDRARQQRFLMQRGFSAQVIARILKKGDTADL